MVILRISGFVISAICCGLVAQLCLTLCDPMECSPPGSSLHGILQARIQGWVAIPFLQGIFPIQGSNLHLQHGKGILYHLSHQGALKQSTKKPLSDYIRKFAEQFL